MTGYFIQVLTINDLCQDRTHPPEYYNPVFDVKIDHGTVCGIIVRRGLVLIYRKESYFGRRQEWHGSSFDIHRQPRLRIPGP